MTELYFKAAVLRETQKPLSVETISFANLDPSQILVKVRYSGVCRSQVMECDGGRGIDPWLPHLLGHEAVGQVHAVGKDVTKVSKGDTVVLTWIECNGSTAGNPVYHDTNGEEINAGKVTTFSEYCVVGEDRVFKKPKSFSDKVAVLLGCALPTGAGMVLNEVTPSLNQKVAIIGLGGIGLSCLVACLGLGIEDITVFDVNEQKLALAKEIGAPFAVNSAVLETPRFHDVFDICYEAAGRCDTIEKAFLTIKNDGVLLFASHPPSGEKISLDPHHLIKGKRIKGSWGGGAGAELTAHKLDLVLKKKEINLNLLLGKTYTIEQVNSAMNDLRRGEERRPIIKFF